MRKRVLLLLFIGACFCLCLSGQGCIIEEGDDVSKYYNSYLDLEDADGDGHYAPESLNTPNDDCNDFDPAIYPGSTETLCDNIDQNCNGMGDDDINVDGDPVSYCSGDCDDGAPNRYPGNMETPCDGVDNNCNGDWDEAPDNDQDGNDVCDFADPYNPDLAGADCNDFDPDVFPGATEECNFTDNDCDTMIDEGCPSRPGMAYIPGDCFEMGDAFDEDAADELPVHTACLSSFDMDVHEVTNAEYAACVGAGGCTAPFISSSSTRASYYGAPAYDDFPVIFVTWNQATAYCSWMEKRLPTEAEWEDAARGGLSGKRYAWGDTIGGADANYMDSGDPWDNDTSQVEYYAPNGYGLYDMAGNVYEWINDWFQLNYYSVSPTNDPPGPASGTSRGARGGGWDTTTDKLRAANRAGYGPTTQYNFIGFRCARD